MDNDLNRDTQARLKGHGRIGVVTVTYNSASVLQPFMECVAKQTHVDFLLYIVDNASKDATLQMVADFADPRFIPIPSAQNVGVAEGNNLGIRAALEAGCDSVLLLNNDTEFGPTMLKELAHGLEDHHVEMTCPKMMYFDEPHRIWAAGGTFQPLYGYRGVHYGEGEIDRGRYDEERIVTYVPTCCVLIARSVFDKIGIMDARYFVYVDDVDFMYRALMAGVKLFYLSKTVLLHKVSSLTGQEESTTMIRFCTRNRVYFLLKHLGWVRSSPYLFAYQAHYLLALVRGKMRRSVYSKKQTAVIEGMRMFHAAQSEKR
ncbi:glycosyltransferase [Granulicella sp. 5B5]|uniref:glycosyltransferase family 2 protein n=1 Tax=Granulicella sp. 5B5 TaxID=1617967 RepID=UPI0015F5C5F9|nr:glycosyltransferase family 2 protein [Granulicella sp. 5B5]QMV19115.1 glycosyltransferase [Granulicella sp. 5B5]